MENDSNTSALWRCVVCCEEVLKDELAELLTSCRCSIPCDVCIRCVRRLVRIRQGCPHCREPILSVCQRYPSNPTATEFARITTELTRPPLPPLSPFSRVAHGVSCLLWLLMATLIVECLMFFSWRSTWWFGSWLEWFTGLNQNAIVIALYYMGVLLYWKYFHVVFEFLAPGLEFAAPPEGFAFLFSPDVRAVTVTLALMVAWTFRIICNYAGGVVSIVLVVLVWVTVPRLQTLFNLIEWPEEPPALYWS